MRNLNEMKFVESFEILFGKIYDKERFTSECLYVDK